MSRVREAVQDDVGELVRLRALLFENLGSDFFTPSSAGDEWRANLAAVLEEQLTADTMRILVVDGDEADDEAADAGDANSDACGHAGGNRLAACGVGIIERSLPGPHLRDGRIGHVIGVVTDPAYRRRGHSRAIMEGLLDWFREHEIARVDLHASAAAEPLYRTLGFADHPDPSLVWRP